MRRALRSIALACLLAPSAMAQSTLFVGPGGFAQIDLAIQAAQPGDTIVITTADRLEPFTLDRGVTIRSAAGIRPLISNALLTRPFRDSTIRIPPGQTAELVGLDFVPEIPGFGVSWHARVGVTGGRVAFRDCNFISARTLCGGGAPTLDTADAEVTVQDCRLYGADYRSPGLRAVRSTVSLADCWLRGGPGCHDGLRTGADGIVLESSTLHACRIEVLGGAPVPWQPTDRGGHGIFVDANSRLWLSDSLVTGADANGRGIGGDGIRNLAPRPVELRNVAVRAGTGPTPGSTIFGPSRNNPSLVAVSNTPRSGPLPGTPFVLEASTAPGSLVAFGLASDVAPQTLRPFEQPLWLTTGGFGPLWIAATTDARGLATYTLNVPPSTVVRGQTFWSQTATLDGSRIQLSPLRGGQIW